jgi:hypothetical protein
MTRTDQKLLLVLLLIGLLTFVWSKFYTHPQVSPSQVVIKVEGEIVKNLTLQEDAPLQRFTIKGKRGQAIVETKGQKVRMLEAPCPDQICVKQGWIESSRQTIVCVPNEVVIYIDEEASVDATTG